MHSGLFPAADQYGGNSAIALHFAGRLVAIALRSQRGNQSRYQCTPSAWKRNEDRKIRMVFDQCLDLLVVGVDHFAQLANHTNQCGGRGNVCLDHCRVGDARSPALITGQDFYRLVSASMNHTEWPRGLMGYPDILAQAGYYVGFTGKGWAPGNWNLSGRATNPCGPEFNQIKLIPPDDAISDIDYISNFSAFLEKRPDDRLRRRGAEMASTVIPGHSCDW